MSGDGVTSTWETGTKHGLYLEVVDEEGEPEPWLIDCWCPFSKNHTGHPLEPKELY
jgi:hypothetical protein